MPVPIQAASGRRALACERLQGGDLDGEPSRLALAPQGATGLPEQLDGRHVEAADMVSVVQLVREQPSARGGFVACQPSGSSPSSRFGSCHASKPLAEVHGY